MYCRHKPSGQAYAFIDGRMIYLGVFGTAASKAEYNRLIAEWLAAGRRLPTDPQAVTIAEVVAAFRRNAAVYYGPRSKTAVNIDESLRPVVKLYARTPAIEFGPLRLKAVRESMIRAGRVRASINRRMCGNCPKAMMNRRMMNPSRRQRKRSRRPEPFTERA